ncbi:MAG: hypothetical protein KOO60_09105 [Gemmatimonadales bacterium]|nr:hypothetical protein [Gemmatimonadales bacterium]
MSRNIKPNAWSPNLGYLCVLLLFLSVLIPTVTQAKNPYEMHRTVEGDPGDGVLGPVTPREKDPEETDSLTVVPAPPPVRELDLWFPLPFIIFMGTNHPPLILWMPQPYLSHNPYEVTRTKSLVRFGRGW